MAFQEPQQWLPPKNFGSARTVRIDTPNRYDVAPEFGIYAIGTGGACSVYSPPESYWYVCSFHSVAEQANCISRGAAVCRCSNHTSGGGAFTFRTPSGLRYTPTAFPRADKWSDPVGDGAVINVWRPSRWSNWMFKWSNFDSKTRTIEFGEGGFQVSMREPDQLHSSNKLTSCVRVHVALITVAISLSKTFVKNSIHLASFSTMLRRASCTIFTTPPRVHQFRRI